MSAVAVVILLGALLAGGAVGFVTGYYSAPVYEYAALEGGYTFTGYTLRIPDTSSEQYTELAPRVPVVVAKDHSMVGAIFYQESSKYAVDETELLALSSTLYCEARGEPWIGMASVADTIRNRVKSKMFPNTYLGVTTQHKQFSCVRNHSNLLANVHIRDTAEKVRFRKIIHLAARAINGDLPRVTSNALFYHTTTVYPYWRVKYDRLGVVGHHVFYTTRGEKL